MAHLLAPYRVYCRPGTWSNALPSSSSSPAACNPCPGNRTSDPSATDPSQCCELQVTALRNMHHYSKFELATILGDGLFAVYHNRTCLNRNVATTGCSQENRTAGTSTCKQLANSTSVLTQHTYGCWCCCVQTALPAHLTRVAAACLAQLAAGAPVAAAASPQAQSAMHVAPTRHQSLDQPQSLTVCAKQVCCLAAGQQHSGRFCR